VGRECNQIDFGNDYPQLLDASKLLPTDRVILDGEIAPLDDKGRSSFQLLQLFKVLQRAIGVRSMGLSDGALGAAITIGFVGSLPSTFFGPKGKICAGQGRAASRRARVRP